MQRQGCPFRGSPVLQMGIYQFITFSTNRWKIAATCALVALPFGMSLPEAPLTSPSATAQPSAALA